MPPLDTTLDILYLALAIATIALAFFLCWSLYYFALSLRNIYIVTSEVRGRIKKLWEVIELLREKLMIGGTAFKLAASAIKELADHVGIFTGKEKRKKSKNS